MNLNNVKQALAALGLFQSIEIATRSAVFPPGDAGKIIYRIVSPAVGGRCYPALAPEGNPGQPSAVYSLSSSTPWFLFGWRIAHLDEVVVELRGTTYAEMAGVLHGVLSAIEAAPEGLQVVSTETGYNSDTELYVALVVVSLTTPWGGDGDYIILPPGEAAALLVPGSLNYDESITDNRVIQVERREWSIVVFGDSEAQERVNNALLAFLIGWQETPMHSPTQAVTTYPLEAGEVVWIHTFTDWREIFQADI